MSAAVLSFTRTPARDSSVAEVSRIYRRLTPREQHVVLEFLGDVEAHKLDPERRWARRAVQSAAVDLFSRLSLEHRNLARARLARRKAGGGNIAKPVITLGSDGEAS